MSLARWIDQLARWVRSLLHVEAQTPERLPILASEFFENRGSVFSLHRESKSAIATLLVTHIDSPGYRLLIAVDALSVLRTQAIVSSKRGENHLADILQENLTTEKRQSHRIVFAWMTSSTLGNLKVLAIWDGYFAAKRFTAEDDITVVGVVKAIAKEVARLKPTTIFWKERIEDYNWEDALLSHARQYLGEKHDVNLRRRDL